MNTKFRMLRGVILATFLALVVTVGGAVASATDTTPIIPTTPTCIVTLVSGDPATAPPAPTCYDPSGNDLDEFLVPYPDEGYDGVTYVDPNRNPYWYDRPNSTNGASQVSVQSMHYDQVAGGYVNGAAWSLTFNTAVTASPTPNTYSVTIGGCSGSASDRIRKVTFNLTNDAGVDGRYIGSIYPEATGNNGAISVADTQLFTRLHDGSSAAIPLVIDADDTPGLVPGFTYKIKVWLADKGKAYDDSNPTRTLGKVLSVSVTKCGTSAVPSSVRPRASIVVVKRQAKFSRAKVILGSNKATQPNKYRVIIDPKRGRTVRKTFDTRYKVLRYGKIHKGTLVKVRFGKKVVRKRF